MCYLQIFWHPFDEGTSGPVPWISLQADDLALELDGVPADQTELVPSLGREIVDAMFDPGHDPDVENVENPRREDDGSLLQFDAGFLQVFGRFRLIVLGFDQFIPGFRLILGKVLVHVTLKHFLEAGKKTLIS